MHRKAILVISIVHSLWLLISPPFSVVHSTRYCKTDFLFMIKIFRPVIYDEDKAGDTGLAKPQDISREGKVSLASITRHLLAC